MKIIKINNVINVIFDNGDVSTLTSNDKDILMDIYNHKDDEEYVRSIVSPRTADIVKKSLEFEGVVNAYKESKHLTYENGSIYLKDISDLTIPEDLASKILQAEIDNNDALLQTYFNFWTLVSLNPDSNVRKNLFWFLQKYNIVITKSGLLVTYRKVELKSEGKKVNHKFNEFITINYMKVKKNKKSPKKYSVVKESGEYKLVSFSEDISSLGTLFDLYNSITNSYEDSTIYTDQRTKTFEIKLGTVVTMPRNECDSNQDITCSRGLHVASKQWLQYNNCFGSIALLALVNPADVVAVPPQDSYGKMRVCAYYPVSILEEREGNLIDLELDNGFEDDFINTICYTGEINNEDSDNYTLNIPEVLELNRSKINDRLLKIARGINKIQE